MPGYGRLGNDFQNQVNPQKPLRITSPGKGAAATHNTRKVEEKVKYDQWSNKTFYWRLLMASMQLQFLVNI
jgi:hypothetical protein